MKEKENRYEVLNKGWDDVKTEQSSRTLTGDS